ncbi:hypothetical protein D3C87_1762460 [compost metagenome]
MNTDGRRLAGHQRDFSEHRQTAEDKLPRIGFILPGELVDEFRRTAFGDNVYFSPLMQHGRVGCRQRTGLGDIR